MINSYYYLHLGGRVQVIKTKMVAGKVGMMVGDLAAGEPAVGAALSQLTKNKAWSRAQKSKKTRCRGFRGPETSKLKTYPKAKIAFFS